MRKKKKRVPLARLELSLALRSSYSQAIDFVFLFSSKEKENERMPEKAASKRNALPSWQKEKENNHRSLVFSNDDDLPRR